MLAPLLCTALVDWPHSNECECCIFSRSSAKVDLNTSFVLFGNNGALCRAQRGNLCMAHRVDL